MSKYSDFRYTPYTNSTNSQFNPALYNNKGAITGCVGTKDMSGGGDIPTSSYYGLKTIDNNTASVLRGSYPPMTVQSHSQCAGSRKRGRKRGGKSRTPTITRRNRSKKSVKSKRRNRKCQMCPCCKCKCKKCCSKSANKKRCTRRHIKKVRMNGGSALSNASYTTLTKLSPTESMLANPVPFGKVNGCVDNYNHYQASKA